MAFDDRFLADVAQAVVGAEVDRRGERLRRPREVEQVHPGGNREEDRAHHAQDASTSLYVTTSAKRPCSALAVRSRTSFTLSVPEPSQRSRGIVAVASSTNVTL